MTEYKPPFFYNSDKLPSWVLDNSVLKVFDDCGIKVEVVYDEKYLSGKANRPLVICRGEIKRARRANLKGGW